jgi:hypothetical protein
MRCKESTPSLQRHDAQGDDQDKYEDVVTANGQHGSASIPQPGRQIISDIARCFLRLAKIDNRAFECIGRYETMLWRQARQILFTLEVLRRRNPNEVGHFKPTGCRSFYLR